MFGWEGAGSGGIIQRQEVQQRIWRGGEESDLERESLLLI